MRKRKARRFEPRYGVSQSTVEEEARWLAQEAADYQVLSPNDLSAKRSERHAMCERSWQHLQLLLDHASERERTLVQCLLFRDFHHILELYLTYVRKKQPDLDTSSPPVASVTDRKTSGPFSEWLFNF